MNKVEALAELQLNAIQEVNQNGRVSTNTAEAFLTLAGQMTVHEVNQAMVLYRKLDPWRVEGSTR